jgi:hypothetical protein
MHVPAIVKLEPAADEQSRHRALGSLVWRENNANLVDRLRDQWIVRNNFRPDDDGQIVRPTPDRRGLHHAGQHCGGCDRRDQFDGRSGQHRRDRAYSWPMTMPQPGAIGPGTAPR